MKRTRRRKCLCCGDLFRADPRNVWHQRYCAKAACRKTAKAASQQRWLSKAENRNYFRGPEHGARVRAWRAAHPGYWRRTGSQKAPALQEDSCAQVIDAQCDSGSLAPAALQEVFAAQPAVLIGLIAHLSDSALQEDIARTSRRLLQLGQDILSGREARAAQTGALSGAGAAGAAAIQLGGSAPGAGPTHRAL